PRAPARPPRFGPNVYRLARPPSVLLRFGLTLPLQSPRPQWILGLCHVAERGSQPARGEPQAAAARAIWQRSQFGRSESNQQEGPRSPSVGPSHTTKPIVWSVP